MDFLDQKQMEKMIKSKKKILDFSICKCETNGYFMIYFINCI